MTDIRDEILKLKKERDAVIMAHLYQPGEIQELADVVGDSLELARKGKEAPQSVIVLCGVHFMAESAALLSPEKTVLLPAADAGCPMADTVTAADVRALKAAHPGAPVVCYVNTSAAVKAECDISCTSSNAERVVAALPDPKVIFVPDRNLGAWIASQVPQKEMIIHPGFCPVHERTTVADVEASRRALPGAKLLAHPECPAAVLKHADFIGSTAKIIAYVVGSDHKEFIIGTEEGILHQLQKQCPDRTYRVLSKVMHCPNMKKNSLVHLRDSLLHMQHRITVPEEIAVRARRTLDRMLEVS